MLGSKAAGCAPAGCFCTVSDMVCATPRSTPSGHAGLQLHGIMCFVAVAATLQAVPLRVNPSHAVSWTPLMPSHKA